MSNMKQTYIAEAALHAKASRAAADATCLMIQQHPGEWYPCGFAFVVIKPARGRFVSYLKSQNIGRAHYGGGYNVWNPSNHPTQWMTAKEAGAQAYARVLREAGIMAEADSTVD